MRSLILSILLSLILTLFLEVLLSFFLGIRKKYDFLIIILINIATNVSINVIINAVNHFDPSYLWTAIMILEVIVVLIEGFVYMKANIFKVINPFLASLILNTVSFLGGLIIEKL